MAVERRVSSTKNRSIKLEIRTLSLLSGEGLPLVLNAVESVDHVVVPAACRSFSAEWKAVGVDDALWHDGINDWDCTYMGWNFFDVNGGPFYKQGKWYYTDTEIFPQYGGWATLSFDVFTGIFERL